MNFSHEEDLKIAEENLRIMTKNRVVKLNAPLHIRKEGVPQFWDGQLIGWIKAEKGRVISVVSRWQGYGFFLVDTLEEGRVRLIRMHEAKQKLKLGNK